MMSLLLINTVNTANTEYTEYTAIGLLPEAASSGIIITHRADAPGWMRGHIQRED